MEAFPYEEDFTSIGTTDEPWEQPPEDVVIAEKEIDYMLAAVNRFFRRPVTRDDIVWQYAGVRPLFEVGGGRDANLSTLTRDYSFEIDHADGQAALLTVFGGKLTTHRKMAEQAVGKLAPYLKLKSPSRTRDGNAARRRLRQRRLSRISRPPCCAPIPDFPPRKSGAMPGSTAPGRGTCWQAPARRPISAAASAPISMSGKSSS